MAFVLGKWSIEGPTQIIVPATQSQSIPQVPTQITQSPQEPPKQLTNEPKSSINEYFDDWLILGFVFALAVVILFLFVGVIDANLGYSLKSFFRYIVLALTVAMLIAGVVEWFVYKKKKMGYFSLGMVLCIIVLMVIVSLSSFIPELLPVSNAILANEGPYTKSTAISELNSMSDYYSNLKTTGDSDSALRAIYTEGTTIGLADISFFQSKLDAASSGPSSGEQLFALVVASQTSPNSISTAVSKFGNINTLMTKQALLDSISKSTADMALINSALTNSVAIDESKLGDSRPELTGKYPDSFWINSRTNAVSYLAEFFAFKKTSIQTSLDSNNYIAAFIEANQLTALKAQYGK